MVDEEIPRTRRPEEAEAKNPQPWVSTIEEEIRMLMMTNWQQPPAVPPIRARTGGAPRRDPQFRTDGFLLFWYLAFAITAASIAIYAGHV
jgi:hypothetical protein